jgi:hypothetical protein
VKNSSGPSIKLFVLIVKEGFTIGEFPITPNGALHIQTYFAQVGFKLSSMIVFKPMKARLSSHVAFGHA